MTVAARGKEQNSKKKVTEFSDHVKGSKKKTSQRVEIILREVVLINS